MSRIRSTSVRKPRRQRTTSVLCLPTTRSVTEVCLTVRSLLCAMLHPCHSCSCTGTSTTMGTCQRGLTRVGTRMSRMVRRAPIWGAQYTPVEVKLHSASTAKVRALTSVQNVMLEIVPRSEFPLGVLMFNADTMCSLTLGGVLQGEFVSSVLPYILLPNLRARSVLVQTMRCPCTRLSAVHSSKWEIRC